MRGLIALAAALALSACGGTSDEEEMEALAAEAEEGAGDVFAETESVESYPGEVVAGETFSEFDERRDELEGERGSYQGYGCTVDCSGHDAGYNWAAENGITDPESCGGNSWSFIEGCRAYAEENGGW